MIINSLSDYNYISGDISSFNIDGNLFINSSSPLPLKGEDLCFLTEFNKLQPTVFWGSKILSQRYGSYTQPQYLQLDTCSNQNVEEVSKYITANQVRNLYDRQNTISKHGGSLYSSQHAGSATRGWCCGDTSTFSTRYQEVSEAQHNYISSLMQILPQPVNVNVNQVDYYFNQRQIRQLYQNQRMMHNFCICTVGSDTTQMIRKTNSNNMRFVADPLNDMDIQVQSGQLPPLFAPDCGYSAFACYNSHVDEDNSDNNYSMFAYAPWRILFNMTYDFIPWKRRFQSTLYDVYLCGQMDYASRIERENEQVLETKYCNFLYRLETDVMIEQGVYASGDYEGRRILDGCMNAIGRSYDSSINQVARIDCCFLFIVAHTEGFNWWE